MMRKRLWQFAAALAVLVMLCFCVSCAQQTQTLTDLLLEESSLSQFTTQGELQIRINDPGMEYDLLEYGLPANLFEDATIKYQISADKENELYKVELDADFSCYDDTQHCTFYVTQGHVYLNAQDFLDFCQLICTPDGLFCTPEEYAEAAAAIAKAECEWLDLPIDEAPSAYGDYFTEQELQDILPEIEKMRSTIGKAYADFKFSGLKANGSSFELELDNAGLANLINSFIDYTIENYEKIATACIAYVNSSSLFDEYDRKYIVDDLERLGYIFDEATLEERQELAETIETTLVTECPIDFALKYTYAKTAADTYTLDEVITLDFDEDYFGDKSTVYFSINNTTKAAKDLQINIPTEKLATPDELS